jgi:EmrB/QacA subfamily drug resistance transporter
MTRSRMSANQHARDRIEAHVWRIAAVVILGMIMSILDTTIVNVALDTLGHKLHSPISSIQWVVTGYLLALAAVIPVTGWAARRFEARRVYLVSVVLFTLGSALCGLANSATSLIIFRVLQGAGGGMIMPVGQMIMAHAAGPKRMGRVMSVMAVPAVLAPVFGPALGGLIIENLSWSWIFFVNVPIGIVAVILGLRILPQMDSGPAGRLDLVGLGLLVAGTPLVAYGVSEIGITGSFTAPTVVYPVLVGLALIGAFVVHALRVERPLLDVRLYANRVFAAASITTFFLAAALFGALILMPLFFQQVRHESVVATGLLVGPQGLGAAVAMPLAGRLTDRFGGGRIALLGVIVICIGTVPLAFMGPQTSLVVISVAQVVRGVGIGLGFMPAMSVAFASLRSDQPSDATPQMNVLQRVGGSIGTALLAVVLQRSIASAGHPLTTEALAGAFRTSYWWALGMTALGVLPCVVLLRAERRGVAAAQAVPAGTEATIEAVGV